jgi:hypothetical protein
MHSASISLHSNRSLESVSESRDSFFERTTTETLPGDTINNYTTAEVTAGQDGAPVLVEALVHD